MIKTIIAGSRGLGYFEVCEAMDACGWTPDVVVSGCAKGVDIAGEQWAAVRGIPVERYPADWERLGKSAGFLRNLEMSKNADSLVLVYDGVSKGSKHMWDIALKRGLKVFVFLATPILLVAPEACVGI